MENATSDEGRQFAKNLVTYSKNTPILALALACKRSVQHEILGPASKYGLNTVQNRKSMVKDAIWTCFKHEVHF